MDFPRTLYKSGGKLKWGKDKYYSSKLVKTESEYDATIEDGYIDNFNEALNSKPVELKIEDKPSWKELAIECGLEGDELKKFMKKNSEQKKRQLEKIKD